MISQYLYPARLDLEDERNLVREINETKEKLELIQITEDNLEKECQELIKLGFYERALKILNNFPPGIIEDNPNFVTIKLQILWIIGMFEDLTQLASKMELQYGKIQLS